MTADQSAHKAQVQRAADDLILAIGSNPMRSRILQSVAVWLIKLAVRVTG